MVFSGPRPSIRTRYGVPLTTTSSPCTTTSNGSPSTMMRTAILLTSSQGAAPAIVLPVRNARGRGRGGWRGLRALDVRERGGDGRHEIRLRLAAAVAPDEEIARDLTEQRVRDHILFAACEITDLGAGLLHLGWDKVSRATGDHLLARREHFRLHFLVDRRG